MYFHQIIEASWGVAIALDVSVSISSVCVCMCVCVCVPAGEFGVVYRGNLTGWKNTDQELVAVKTLKGITIIEYS